MTRKGDGPAQRFFRSVLSAQTDECINWPFCKIDGYGAMAWEGQKRVVSHLVCQVTHGAPPTSEHEAAHSCGNRACANPRHIRWKTILENNREKMLHGTVPKGEAHWAAKLTESDAKTIARLVDVPSSEMAAMFGVTAGTVLSIRGRRTWAHLKTEAA